MISSSRKETFKAAGLGCIGSLAFLKLIHFDDPISVSLFLSWCISGILTGPLTKKLHHKIISSWGRIYAQPIITYYSGILILWVFLILGRILTEAVQGIDTLNDSAAYSPEVYAGLLFILLFLGTFVLGSVLLPVWMGIQLKKKGTDEQGKETFSSRLLIDLLILSLFWGSSFFMMTRTLLSTFPTWQSSLVNHYYYRPYLDSAKQNIPELKELLDRFSFSRVSGLTHSSIEMGSYPYTFTFLNYDSLKVKSVFHKRYYLEILIPTEESFMGTEVIGPGGSATYFFTELEYVTWLKDKPRSLEYWEYTTWRTVDSRVCAVFKEPLRELSDEEVRLLKENDWALNVLGIEIITDSPVPEVRPTPTPVPQN